MKILEARRHPRTLPSLVAGAILLLASPAWGQLGTDLELLPSPGPVDGEFGASVAIDGGVVAVGSPFGDGVGVATGSAFLFDASTGALLLPLSASDGAPQDQFGFTVAIDDGLVVVGARYDDENGANSGSAYVFDASSGAQLAKLLPADGAAGDEFGFAVALDDGIAAVGANRDDDNGLDSGSLYLFDATSGEELAKLHPNDGGPIANFGESLDMDQGILAVGAHGDDQKGILAGAAYLFDIASRTQVAKLVADDGGSNDFFGAAIALGNGVVAVGAWADSIFFDHSGSAYLFDVSTGAQITKLIPTDGHDKDHFGYSIAIDGGVVAIGAELDDDTAFDAGSAYLYEASSGAPLGKILAGDGGSHDNFGFAVAIEKGVVAIGAPRHDELGSDVGSVYLADTALVASKEVLRVGSPPNPVALLSGVTSGPVVGAVWDPIVDHSSFVPGASLDVLFVSLVPTPTNLPTAIGTVLCDLSTYVYATATPGTALSVAVPSNDALAGVELCTQAVSLDALTAAPHLTNALDITVGSL